MGEGGCILNCIMYHPYLVSLLFAILPFCYPYISLHFQSTQAALLTSLTSAAAWIASVYMSPMLDSSHCKSLVSYCPLMVFMLVRHMIVLSSVVSWALASHCTVWVQHGLLLSTTGKEHLIDWGQVSADVMCHYYSPAPQTSHFWLALGSDILSVINKYEGRVHH